MQHIFLLSAYEITAAAFFQKLKQERTDLVLDIRLNNTSQLCGFTKEKDLSFLFRSSPARRIFMIWILRRPNNFLTDISKNICPGMNTRRLI